MHSRLTAYERRVRGLAARDEAAHAAKGIELIMSAGDGGAATVAPAWPLPDVFICRLPREGDSDETLREYCLGYDSQKLAKADRLYLEGERDRAMAWMRAIKAECGALHDPCAARLADIAGQMDAAAYRQKYAGESPARTWVSLIDETATRIDALTKAPKQAPEPTGAAGKGAAPER